MIKLVSVTVTSDLQAVTCSDDGSLREMVEVAVQRLYDALSPTCHAPSRGRPNP